MLSRLVRGTLLARSSATLGSSSASAIAVAGAAVARPRLTLLALRPITTNKLTVISASTQEERLDHQRRNRPLSPHLTIYKWTPSMMLSIMHRGTGLYMTGLFALGGLAAVAFPHDVPTAVNFLKQVQIPLLLPAVKFAFAFPFVYHTIHGVRHLIWDRAKMLSGEEEVDRWGWIAIGTAVSVSAALAFLKF